MCQIENNPVINLNISVSYLSIQNNIETYENRVFLLEYGIFLLIEYSMNHSVRFLSTVRNW